MDNVLNCVSYSNRHVDILLEEMPSNRKHIHTILNCIFKYGRMTMKNISIIIYTVQL
jgi:hypothetical protein